MALTVLPDFKLTLTDYLRDLAEIDALDLRVATASLGDSKLPWVRVTVGDSPRIGPIDHLIEYYLFIDVFAGKTAQVAGTGAEQVDTAQRTVRAALNALPETDLEGLVVTGVTVSGGDLPPDTTVEPARERHQLTVTVWAHPE